MGSVLDCGAAATKPSQLRVSFRAKSECHGGAGAGAGASRGPSPLPCHRLSVPSARPRPTSAHSDTRYTLSGGLRSGGHSVHCSLGSRGQGGPGAQEAAWLCGDETGNELIRSCGALSKVPPHCHVSRVTCHEPCAGAGPPAELQLRRHRVGAQLAAAAAPRPLRQLARVRRLRLQLGRPGRRAPRQARR